MSAALSFFSFFFSFPLPLKTEQVAFALARRLKPDKKDAWIAYPPKILLINQTHKIRPDRSEAVARRLNMWSASGIR